MSIVVNLAMKATKLGVHINNKSRILPWFYKTGFVNVERQYFNFKFVCEVTLLGKYERTHLLSFIQNLNMQITNISIWWIIIININKYNIFVCIYISKYNQISIIYTNSRLHTHIIAYCTKCTSFPNFKFHVLYYHILYIVVNIVTKAAKLGVHINNKSRMLPWFYRTHFC